MLTPNEEEHMPQDGREFILHWLQDAHAMENQSVHMMESQLPSLTGFPEFRASAERHAAISREQRNRLAPDHRTGPGAFCDARWLRLGAGL